MTPRSGRPAARRADPRPARTRAALVAAGRRLIASGRTSVSIRTITDEAGVGFGSFSNHFGSKDELFEASVASALDAWGDVRDAVVEGIEDPAEVFALSFRMIGRMQRQLPEIVKTVLHQGMSILRTDRGIRPRALLDLERGIRSARFTVPSAEVGMMMAGGVLLGLMELLDGDPDLDDGETSDVCAKHVLLMLGLDEREAERLVSLPLPEVSTSQWAVPAVT